MHSLLDKLIFILLILARIVVRFGCLGLVFVIYFLQLIALGLRKKNISGEPFSFWVKTCASGIGCPGFCFRSS
jgi:hypothetical protein